jgi:hypothetical protein
MSCKCQTDNASQVPGRDNKKALLAWSLGLELTTPEAPLSEVCGFCLAHPQTLEAMELRNHTCKVLPANCRHW